MGWINRVPEYAVYVWVAWPWCMWMKMLVANYRDEGCGSREWNGGGRHEEGLTGKREIGRDQRIHPSDFSDK